MYLTLMYLCISHRKILLQRCMSLGDCTGGYCTLICCRCMKYSKSRVGWCHLCSQEQDGQKVSFTAPVTLPAEKQPKFLLSRRLREPLEGTWILREPLAGTWILREPLAGTWIGSEQRRSDKDNRSRLHSNIDCSGKYSSGQEDAVNCV